MHTQISMFELMDEYETPQLPPAKQKAGTIAWIIEFSGIFLRENGEWHGVCTRPVILEEDTDEADKHSAAHTIKGSHQGWYGGLRQLFARRPTWNDCLRWARENQRKGDPEEVRYYDQDGNWNGIYRYEDGW